jgi:hypothetical protein
LRQLLAPGKAVLRAARVITVIADIVSALVVDLATARVLRIAAAALRAGVGFKNFVVVEALAVVLVEPPCLAPLSAEDSSLTVERIAVNAAVDALVAVVAARGVVQLAEICDLRLKAAVAAAAINVGLGITLRLAAEEEVGHFESVPECIALKRTSLWATRTFKFTKKKGSFFIFF